MYPNNSPRKQQKSISDKLGIGKIKKKKARTEPKAFWDRKKNCMLRKKGLVIKLSRHTEGSESTENKQNKQTQLCASLHQLLLPNAVASNIQQLPLAF